MSEPITEAQLVLADGTTFEGEAIGATPRRRGRTGRGGVQHRAHRLPGGPHRPLLRRPDHHLHLPPHRQLRRDPGRRRERPAVLPGCDRPRPGPAPQQLAQPRRPRRLPAPPRRGRHRRHRHPPAHPPPARRRAPCPARSAPPTTAALEGGRPRRARHRRRRPGPAWSPAPSPTRSGDGPRRVVAYDFGIKRAILAQLGEIATVEVVPAIDHRRRRAGPPARRGVPVQRARRPGRGRLRRRRHPRPAGRGARLRDLPGPPAAGHRPRRPRPTSSPFGHHGGNHPVRRLDTGAVEITSQNHNYSVLDAPVDRRRGHPPQPQRRHGRGPALARGAGLQRAAPPRGRAGPARRPLPVRPVRRAHGRSSRRAPGR